MNNIIKKIREIRDPINHIASKYMDTDTKLNLLNAKLQDIKPDINNYDILEIYNNIKLMYNHYKKYVKILYYTKCRKVNQAYKKVFGENKYIFLDYDEKNVHYKLLRIKRKFRRKFNSLFIIDYNNNYKINYGVYNPPINGQIFENIGITTEIDDMIELLPPENKKKRKLNKYFKFMKEYRKTHRGAKVKDIAKEYKK